MPEKDLTMEKYNLRKKALEICCYVAGAGAFGVFIRWLQLMMAFNDEGLVDKSFFNIAFPVFCVVSSLVFLRFIDKMRLDRYYLSTDFFVTLHNHHRVYVILRWLVGAVMTIGGLMLFISAETDKNSELLQILALMAVLNGFLFPLHLSTANKPHVASPRFTCFCAFWPILMFCMWLVSCYKINAINSVLWSYTPEIITHIVAINAFFHVAGYAYGNPKPWRCLFFCMVGTMMCILVIADERYMGMQLMYAASAAMLLMYCWIMVCNLLRGDKEQEIHPDDGFERL